MVKFDDLRLLAARVAGSADLNEVRLFNVEGNLDQLPTGTGGLSYNFDAEVEVQQVPETNALIVDGKYELVVHFVPEGSTPDEAPSTAEAPDPADAADDATHEHLAHLNFHLAALYSLPDHEQVVYAEDELDAFGKTTGLLTLHPYAREFVSDMTSRMGLPSLHLGTIRFQIDKPDTPER